jgi:hypothetical protein
MSLQKSGPSTATTGSSQSIQNVSLPEWFQSYWQNALGQATGLSQNQNYLTAGLTPDQITGSVATNNALASWLNRPQVPAYDVFGMATTPAPLYASGAVTDLARSVMGGGGRGAPGPQAPGSRDAPTVGQAAQAQAAQARAAQLFQTEIAPFMNPYINSVIDPTLSRMQQQQNDIQARIAADAAAGGMYGGSREAVASAIGDRDYRSQLAQTAGGMLNQGWQTATQDAMGNVANRQQTNLANAGLQNQVNLANAQMASSMSQAQLQNATQRDIANAQIGGNLAGQQMTQANQVAMADADRFLRALATQQTMDTANLQGTLDIARLLAQFGGQEQTTAQNALNSYWGDLVNQLRPLSIGVSPGATTSTQTASSGTGTQQQNVDLAQILLGTLGVLARPGSQNSLLSSGLGSLSDPKDKTDVQHLGKENGVDMYAYRYAGDPKTYPKVVGPMADQIEKLMPGVTHMIAGHRVIKHG